MQCLPAFLPSRPGSLFRFDRKTSLASSSSVKCSVSENALPDAGLITKPGITGTVCTNLWPIPVFGAYSWFLNVYDRDVAAAKGAFTIQASRNATRLTLSFSDATKAGQPKSDSHRTFPGIVTGNLNVDKHLRELADPTSPYLLKFFEKGGSEFFFQRQNEIHLPDPSSTESNSDGIWADAAPTYFVLSQLPEFEVREIHSVVKAAPRSPSKFEYFAMNLHPIFPLAKYSCFVCVWKQKAGTPSVAIDKMKGSLALSFFQPREIASLPTKSEVSSLGIAKFAVKTFLGAVTDGSIAAEHKFLLSAIRESPSIACCSETDFRVVLENTPNTLTSKRRNEIWIQVA